MDQIPNGITRDYILSAISDFNDRFPHEFHESTDYDLIHQKRRYPPKAVIGLAARHIIGKPLKPKDFKGGLKSKCFRILEQNGFKIKPKQLGHWVFQGNPDVFDVDASFEEPEEFFWEVRLRKHRSEIRIGDRGMIWRASGSKSKADAGIIAICTVVELPGEFKKTKGVETHYPQAPSHWAQEGPKTGVFCKLKVEEMRLSPDEGMLGKDLLLADEVLSKIGTLTYRTGTTFRLDQTQFDRIMFYWTDDLGEQEEPRDLVVKNAIYFEGRAKECRSILYERSKPAREDCLKEYGYDCSVCEMNFEESYGEVGKQFIHVHHIDPVASKTGEYEIDPQKDLIPVCPNCHAMIHKKTPPYSVEELKQLLMT